MKSIFNSESGQALLIVVLVMVVVLTTALSVSLRSVTNLRTSTEEENSQRAFYAAEAGIEKALKTTDTGPLNRLKGSVGNEATIKEVKASAISGAQFLLAGGNPIEKDDGVDVWFVGHDSDGAAQLSGTQWGGTITVYWGTSATECANAALEAIVFRDTDSEAAVSVQATRYALDPCSSRRTNNRFVEPTPEAISCGGKTFYYRTQLSVSAGLLGRLTPLYTNTPMCVVGSSSLPSQGRKIESVGTSGTTQRKVIVYQGYPKVPAELFQYSLFAPR